MSPGEKRTTTLMGVCLFICHWFCIMSVKLQFKVKLLTKRISAQERLLNVACNSEALGVVVVALEIPVATVFR